MCTNVGFSPLTPIYSGSSECIFPKQIMEIRLKYWPLRAFMSDFMWLFLSSRDSWRRLWMVFTIPAVSQFWKMSWTATLTLNHLLDQIVKLNFFVTQRFSLISGLPNFWWPLSTVYIWSWWILKKQSEERFEGVLRFAKYHGSELRLTS